MADLLAPDEVGGTELTTQGTAKSGEQPEGGIEAIIQAFRAASRNLLARTEFHTPIAGEAAPRAREERPPIPVGYTQWDQPIVPRDPESIITDARMAVVTIFAGDAHSSGFLISRDGYVLTNEHVVREGKFVTVRFVTGREVNGEVVRTDRPRDVALVRPEYDLYRTLPLGHSASVKPGAEVYTIGTPLDAKLEQTVTKGIVSGYQEEYGQRMIQSDVNVLPGNSGGPLLDRNGNVDVPVGLSIPGRPPRLQVGKPRALLRPVPDA